MRVSLAFILALSLAGLQFLAILIFVFTSFLTSERAMLEHALGLMSQAGKNATEHTRQFLSPAQDLANMATGLISSGVIPPDDFAALERMMFQSVLSEPQVAGIYYGDNEGNFVYVMRTEQAGILRTKLIDRDKDDRKTTLIYRRQDFTQTATELDPEDKFDPRLRPWFQLASTENTAIWTEPYIFFSSGRPGISAAVPVEDKDGSLIGVVGVDIEINEISDFLAELDVSSGSGSLILNDKGKVIAHPNSSRILVQSDNKSIRFADINEISDPVAQAAFGGQNFTGTFGADIEIRSDLEIQKKSYLTLLRPIQGLGLPWAIAISAPEDDFVQRIKDNRRRNIWIAAGISMVTALVGLLLAEMILRPVRAFAVRTSLVSQGEVSPNTPLPRTYRELKHANETLIDEITQRRDSEAKQKELSRQLFQYSRVDMLGQLATGLAHELSQPVTAITQNVDAAISLANKQKEVDPKLIQILAELDDQAHRSGDIIHALRGLLRDDESEKDTFGFYELTDQVRRIVQHEADASNVTLLIEKAPNDLVSANRVQIAQVLINLLHNAIEAMVNAETKMREIRIVPNVRGSVLEVWVDDSGPGVDPNMPLFKQFVTSKSDGMGLGLSISKTLVEANGGHLWYDFKHTQASRFCFSLPLLVKGTGKA